MKHVQETRGAFAQHVIWVVGMLVAISLAAYIPSALAQASAGANPNVVAEQGEEPGPSENPASDSVADPEKSEEFVGEMYQIGLGWHPAGLEGLPTDKFGLVDWVAALEQGMIKPRSNIDPNGPEGVPFDMNIVMPSKTGMIAGAYFPHKTHTTWMSCDSCHIKIFMPLAGSNDLTMSTIANGQACGVCHGKVAFPLNDCTRCHISRSDADGGATAAQ
jgi:c(7)-type cytochrome triheme protein